MPLAPVIPPVEPEPLPEEVPPEPGENGDPHLHSTREVDVYHIAARDGETGHVDDFIVEDGSWFVRYLVVDTRNWLPGRKVLVAPAWIDRLEWAEAKVHVDMTRQRVAPSPTYDPAAPVNREYEERLYDYYGRPHYWR
ncbi:MAG: PRC-barrel domain-containing protein [Candidatus Latescibacterota bacterium]